MSVDEGEVRRDDEEEGRAAKPARDPGASTTQRSPSMPCTTRAPTESGAADSTEQTRVQDGPQAFRLKRVDLICAC